MRRWAIGALAGLLSGLASCLLEVDEGVSCGDGYVSAAEECDPADPALGFLDACRARGFERDAACDPVTCRLLDSDAQCNRCGDGVAVVADDEECDGSDHRGLRCPSDPDAPDQEPKPLRCNADCTLDYDGCDQRCGDDVVTDDEECDVAAACDGDDDCDNGAVCNGHLCVRLADDLSPIDACSELAETFVVGKKRYVGGEVVDCDSECKLDRTPCNFCGDGVLDVDLAFEDELDVQIDADEPSPLTRDEVCDGEVIAEDVLAQWCEDIGCNDPAGLGRRYGCDFECEDDCSGIDLNNFQGSEPEDCCLLADEPCGLHPTDICCNADPDMGSITLGVCEDGFCN